MGIPGGPAPGAQCDPRGGEVPLRADTLTLILPRPKLGYLETRGAFAGRRYIPFSAIRSILPDEVRLNVAKDVVSRMYKRTSVATPEVVEIRRDRDASDARSSPPLPASPER